MHYLFQNNRERLIDLRINLVSVYGGIRSTMSDNGVSGKKIAMLNMKQEMEQNTRNQGWKELDLIEIMQCGTYSKEKKNE